MNSIPKPGQHFQSAVFLKLNSFEGLTMAIDALFQTRDWINVFPGLRPVCLYALLCGLLLQPMEHAIGQTMSSVDDSAQITVPQQTRIPFSGLASEQAKKNYLDLRDAYQRVMEQT